MDSFRNNYNQTLRVDWYHRPFYHRTVFDYFYTERFRIAVRNAVANDAAWNHHQGELVKKYVKEHLDSDQKMQQALTVHLTDIEQQLDTTVRDKIREIVSEDQYHTVNKAFFETTEYKVQERFGTVLGQIPDISDRIEQLEKQVSILKWISGLSVLSVLGIGAFVIRR